MATGARVFNLDHHLAIHPEVADALARHRPVVALESTIISHGFPWPQNLEVAQAAEAVIRREGTVPATIAILDGVIQVGLAPSQIEALAQRPGVIKVSRRNLSLVLGQGAWGATTVAATMWCSARAGIRVFATGGIGGVHRGGAQSFDISADLQELARTPVIVTCAGAKAILDIGLTLEYLETHGVPVIGYGTDRFPGFYVPATAYAVDGRLDTPEAVARTAHIHWGLGLESGLLVGCPVPESAALSVQTMDDAIGRALEAAAAAGIARAEVTPFLLDEIRRTTEGESIGTNIALVCNNAAIGARIAGALSVLGEAA
ncbi:MAG TPA: pseudouridine-5'-phosphate glycosidase [Chloroflexota bacterium]|nr:pseudouridine-5'-phosphate glycosidase [Chloroflexota bacterium]